jgi:hypothetical protein
VAGGRPDQQPLLPGDRPPTLISVQHDLIMAYRREAAKREVSTARLIQTVLSTVIEDHLVAAVLDTDEPPREP